MLLGQKHIKCFARPIYEPFLILLSVCVLYKIKVYVSSSLPISKMKIMLVYLICFGHNSILFCFLGNMLIKFEDLKFKLFNCSLKESCQGAIINNTKHVIFNSCTYHSALSPITFFCPVNERAWTCQLQVSVIKRKRLEQIDKTSFDIQKNTQPKLSLLISPRNV